MSTRIKELGFDVRSKLESGMIITDATQCAMELVENALDAKCTAVAVRVNLKNFTIEVVDNGTGISPDDLNLIGERYMTSKCWNSNDVEKNITFGYRGQAIASIIDVCTQLFIKTKSDASSNTLTKVFSKGRPPSITVSSRGKCSNGTTVRVCGFMSTMPVRQQRITEIFDMREIRNQMEYLALIHSEVCFTLRDENKGEIILESRTGRNAGLCFADLFGLALGKFLAPLSYTHQNIEIQGFIGLRRHSEDNLQFFYVNKRIISKSITHKVVNSLIDRYINEREILMEEESPAAGMMHFKQNKNCHNVFLVHIRCPYTCFEMFRNLRKTTAEFKNWDVVFCCLKNAIKTALSGESLKVGDDRNIEKRKNENVNILPQKSQAELGQLMCGIRGMFVKRKQCHFVLSNREALTDRAKFTRNGGANDGEEISLVDEIRNDVPQRRKVSRPANEVKRNPEKYKMAKPLHYQMGNLELEQQLVGRGTAASDILTEFAAWLKSKMQRDCFLRKIYGEFVEELAEKRKAMSRKRKKGIGNWENAGTRKKNLFCEEVNAVKRGNPSVLQSNSNGNSSEVMQPENEVVKKLKKRKKSDLNKRIQRKNGAVGEELVKNEFANDLAEPGSSTRITRSAIKRVTSGDSGGSKIRFRIRGESSKSWTSHKNRPHPSGSHVDLRTKISRVRLYTGEKKFLNQETNENSNCLSDFTGNHGAYGDILKEFPADAPSNKSSKAVNWCGEAETKASEAVINCDKGIQINFPESGHVLNERTKWKASESFPGDFSGRMAEEGVKVDSRGELPSRSETDLSGNRKEMMASPPPNSAVANPDAKWEESITSGDFRYCQTVRDQSEKPEGEPLKSNSRLANSLANTDPRPGIPCQSSDCTADVPPRSGGCESWENFFPSEESVAENLPDTLSLSLMSKGYVSSESGDPIMFSCMERYSFIPKGLSPTVLERSFDKFGARNKEMLEGISTVPNGARKENSCDVFTKSLLPDDCIEDLKERTMEKMIYYERELVKPSMTKTESKIFASMNCFDVEKGLFSNAKVIGQWDKKFIVVKTNPILPKEKHLLFVFDQHAVDERIRLEKLLKESKNADGKFISARCNPPVKCRLEASMLRLIPVLEKVLPNFGVKVSAVDSHHMLFVEIPLFLTEDNTEDAETFLRSLVSDVVEELSVTRGSGSTLPGAIYSKLSTKACKSAVKFNEYLSEDEMAKMISDLAQCQSPFLCAHGRPSAVPILELEAFRDQVAKGGEKLNFERLRKMNTKKE